MKLTPKPLTLGNIAQYCHVNRVTVQRWVKDNLIPSYRTPGGHYRVDKVDFLKFLEKNEMPVYQEFFQDVRQRILVCDSSLEDGNIVAGLLAEDSPFYELKVCSSGQETLIQLGQFQPTILILNVELNDLGGSGVCRSIKESLPEQAPSIVAISDFEMEESQVIQSGADRYIRKPLGEQILKSMVRGLLDAPEPADNNG